MSYNDEIAISVEHLSKAYKIFKTPGARFVYHLFRTNGGDDFAALDDVSFEVRKGESFGIIGRNGSGKSTMLQILAGIIKATAGSVKVNGRIAALLELGSGFNPESTGYENIYMNAAILGLKKDEIENKISQIIEFADIGDFINQPVKTYSSGMYIRLAFSVAINVDADILLIDEALAVGDVFFRQKCYAKLNQLKEEGKTIVLVSHGMNEVEQFCDRALLLSHGKTVTLGNSKDCVKKYYLLEQEENAAKRGIDLKSADTKEWLQWKTSDVGKFRGWSLKEEVFLDLCTSSEIGNGKVTFLRAGLFNAEGKTQYSFEQGETMYIYEEVLVKEQIRCPLFGAVIYDQRNVIVHGKDSLQLGGDLPGMVPAGTIIQVLHQIKLDVAEGEYTLTLGANSMSKEDYEERSYRNQEEVNQTLERICDRNRAAKFSVYPLKVGNPMQIMFHGCCDLPGSIQISMRTTS